MNEDQILNSLRSVMDPELGVNIVDLGLVYAVEIEGNEVKVSMTMTSQSCPLGSYLKDQVNEIISKDFPDSAGVGVEMVSDPPWNADMMSEDAKKLLGR
jgi:metal-sulfur cluster biosynthetic enzyme